MFGKIEKSGDGVVGLFDTNMNLAAASETITTTTRAIGLPGDSSGTSWKISGRVRLGR